MTGMSQRYASAEARRWLFIVATALISAVSFEVLAVTTAMPTIARVLDGEALYALANGGALVTQLLTTALTGVWVDARGPRRPLLAGLALIVAGLLVCTLAPSMHVLALGRVIQGVGGGLTMVPLYVLVGSCVPPDRQSAYFAAFAAAWVIPSLIGPAITGLLVDHAHWRWVFAIVPILLIGLAPATWHMLRMMPPPTLSGELGELRSIALPAVGTAACTLALYLISGRESYGAPVYVGIGVSMLGIVYFVRPLFPRGTLLLSRGLPSSVAYRLTSTLAFIGIEVYLPLMLQRIHGWSPTAAGMTLTVGTVSWAGASALEARLSSSGRQTGFIVAGASFLTLGAATTIPLAYPSAHPVFIIATWAIAGFGMGLALPAVTTHALGITERQGETSSALQIADTLGGALSIAFAGIFFTIIPGARPASFALAITALSTFGILSIAVARRTAIPSNRRR